MKGYVVITEDKTFEIKELNLISWKEEGKEKKYGVDFGNECVQELEIGVFAYLKKLDDNSFTKALRYIMKKGKLKDYVIAEYDKDDLAFWNNQLELSRKRIEEDIVVEIKDLKERLQQRIKVFERMNNVSVLVEDNHYCIEDNATNRLKFYDTKIKFKEMLNGLIEEINEEI